MAGEHILIVEDEEDVVELIRYNLGKEGFRCESAGTGQGALESTIDEIFTRDLFNIRVLDER